MEEFRDAHFTHIVRCRVIRHPLGETLIHGERGLIEKSMDPLSALWGYGAEMAWVRVHGRTNPIDLTRFYRCGDERPFIVRIRLVGQEFVHR